MATVHDSIGKVRNKIKDNILSEENPVGLLTLKKQDYLQCLDMNYRHLNEMLREDEIKWALNLETKKGVADQVNQELKTLLERQKAAIDAFMKRSMSMYTPVGQSEAKFTLKKLPMWGEQAAAHEINFEWPTQEMVNRWPQEVTLQSITFSTRAQTIFTVSSVQCTVSTGE